MPAIWSFEHSACMETAVEVERGASTPRSRSPRKQLRPSGIEVRPGARPGGPAPAIGATQEEGLGQRRRRPDRHSRGCWRPVRRPRIRSSHRSCSAGSAARARRSSSSTMTLPCRVEHLADTLDDRTGQAEVALAVDDLHRREAADAADQLAHRLMTPVDAGIARCVTEDIQRRPVGERVRGQCFDRLPLCATAGCRRTGQRVREVMLGSASLAGGLAAGWPAQSRATRPRAGRGGRTRPRSSRPAGARSNTGRPSRPERPSAAGCIWRDSTASAR